MAAVIDGYLTRLGGVVKSRMKGPRARRGTKWWADSAQAAHTDLLVDAVEVKAVDAGYVLPDKLVNEVSDAVRPVALRVARDAAADTAQRLGYGVDDVTGDGMFAVDEQAIAQAVEDAIAEMLGSAEHHAEEVRKAVLDKNGSAESLDELLTRIDEANQLGGKWLLLRGRNLAHALANRAAYEQARALGVRTSQWLSRRDERVRPTHVAADGQVRPMDEKYQVGRWRLLFPGDPTDMPESGEEVHGCRCTLLFSKPDAEVRKTLEAMANRLDKLDAAAERLLKQATKAPTVSVPGGVSSGLAQAAGAAGQAAQVTTTEPVVGYRLLDAALAEAVPGQRLVIGGSVVLGLAASAAAANTVPLAVMIPAGTGLLVVGGAVVLAQGTQLEVLAAGPNGVEAQAVAA